MDIDCDGANSHGGNCGYDESIQDQTSFKDLVVSQYGIPDLDANIHPYVVFGNTDYDPQRDGMWPLSVMVVVCGNQLVSGPLRRSGLLCKGGDGLLMRRGRLVLWYLGRYGWGELDGRGVDCVG